MEFKSIVLGLLASSYSLCMLGLILSLNVASSNHVAPCPWSNTLNDRPVIGVLSQSTTASLSNLGDAYIAASYVKFLESAGARVVPILIKQPDSYYQKMFAALNGVLFPGGALNNLNVTEFGRAGRLFYDLALKSYEKRGDYFPIWGTCLGMELLVLLTSNQYLLTDTDALDTSYPLTFTKRFHDSRLFHGADQSILKILSTENVTYNNHHFGLTPTNFTKSSALSKFYRLLSTNVDDKGVTFISSMEAIYYPIYGTQFHPEKNIFEWKSPNINHSADAVVATQFFANFFVAEARKNYHSFSRETVDSYLIYKYSPVYTGNVSSFEQCYFFDV